MFSIHFTHRFYSAIGPDVGHVILIHESVDSGDEREQKDWNAQPQKEAKYGARKLYIHLFNYQSIYLNRI